MNYLFRINRLLVHQPITIPIWCLQLSTRTPRRFNWRIYIWSLLIYTSIWQILIILRTRSFIWMGIILNNSVRQARWRLTEITAITRSTRNNWHIIWDWHMWPRRFWKSRLAIMFPKLRIYINILTSVRLTWVRFTVWFVTNYTTFFYLSRPTLI